MPRKSIALFLATTGLISSLAGCSPGKEADEKGGDGMPSPAAGQSAQPTQDNGDKHSEDDKEGKGSKGENGDKGDEGGEGGEGGEG
jgi:hypothetical protein